MARPPLPSLSPQVLSPPPPAGPRDSSGRGSPGNPPPCSARKAAPAWLMPTPWPQPRTVNRNTPSSYSQVNQALRRPKAVRASSPGHGLSPHQDGGRVARGGGLPSWSHPSSGPEKSSPSPQAAVAAAFSSPAVSAAVERYPGAKASPGLAACRRVGRSCPQTVWADSVFPPEMAKKAAQMGSPSQVRSSPSTAAAAS